MGNPKPEKVAVVDEVKDRLSGSDSVVITEYRGLTVDHLQTLRGQLRPVGGRYKIYKNTLVRRAANEVGFELDDHLVGPTALAFTEETPDGDSGDVVTVAKVLRDFAKANPQLVIKGGVLDGEIIDAEGINKLADVEPREVLLAKLAGAMAAPMQQFAGLLQALPRDFAYGLKALIDEGGASGAAPSDSPTSEAAPSDSPTADAESEADATDNAQDSDGEE